MANIALRPRVERVDVDEAVRRQYGDRRDDNTPETPKVTEGTGNTLFYCALAIAIFFMVTWALDIFSIPRNLRYASREANLALVGMVVVFAAGCWPYKILRPVGIGVLAVVLIFQFGRRPAAAAGVDMVTYNMNELVLDHTDQVEDETFATNSYRDSNGRIILKQARTVALDAAGQVAEADIVRAEAIAKAKGLMLPAPTRFLPADRTTWMATGIPVYDSCVLLSAKGKVKRGIYTQSGPNGIELEKMSDQQRIGYMDIDKNRDKMVRNLPWGTFSGKICKDAAGEDCGPEFGIGENLYVTGKRFGYGNLWVIVNGFVSRDTGASRLSGLPDINTSDYNAYQGGYQFDQEPAPDYKCDLTSTVAAR